MDYYDLKNMEWSGEYLCNSMGADLLAKVLREVSITDSVQEIFISVILFCLSDPMRQCSRII